MRHGRGKKEGEGRGEEWGREERGVGGGEESERMGEEGGRWTEMKRGKEHEGGEKAGNKEGEGERKKVEE